MIHDLKLIKAAPAYWDVEATVSKGTYIRALARDIGEAVGSKAHLASLRRIRSGTVSIEKALSLAELEKGFERCKNNGDPAIRNFFLDPCADVGISPEQLPEGLRHAFYQ